MRTISPTVTVAHHATVESPSGYAFIGSIHLRMRAGAAAAQLAVPVQRAEQLRDTGEPLAGRRFAGQW